MRKVGEEEEGVEDPSEVEIDEDNCSIWMTLNAINVTKIWALSI